MEHATDRVAIVLEGEAQVRHVTANGVEQSFVTQPLRRISTMVRSFLDIESLLSPEVELRLTGPDLDATRSLQIDDTVREQAARLMEARETKRAWLREHAVCPECRAALEHGPDLVRCANGHEFQQGGFGLDMLSGAIRDRAKLVPGLRVSRHAVDANGKGIIERTRERGGKVLDFGAGLKFAADYDPDVIALDIEDYPTTDVVAAGQRLPFKDDTFEGVISFSVLEHVSDPFACAAEIARVLKPGGMICIGAPFLFQEHGYPEHYYNFSRRGLANLFEDKLEIVKQSPGAVSIPSLVRSFMSDIPPEHRERWANVTLGDLWNGEKKLRPQDQKLPPLPETIRWRFAHGSHIWATKPDPNVDPDDLDPS